MKLNEFQKKYCEEIQQVKNSYKDDLIKWLHDNHLDGLVKSKETGKLGHLSVNGSFYRTLGYEINFHPLKKDGTPSLRCSGYISDYSDIESLFEPYEEKDNG